MGGVEWVSVRKVLKGSDYGMGCYGGNYCDWQIVKFYCKLSLAGFIDCMVQKIIYVGKWESFVEVQRFRFGVVLLVDAFV